MSDTPKKPRAKKKAAPRAEPNAAAAAETPPESPRAEKQGTKSDDTLKAAVLAAALPHAAFDGFSQKVLDEAGKEAGVAKADLKRLFPEGPLGVVEFYSAQADAEMERRLAALDLSKMKIRARIAAAVTARLGVLKPNKEAARRAAALLSLPMHAALGARLMYRTVDAMWRAAGDTATDFNFYTKRGILAGVYGSTLMRWFNDTSADESATTEFLAARIENVMQFETFKAQVKTGFGRFAAAFAQARKS
jgi:ubiquinone biosynthesis protein COQ9